MISAAATAHAVPSSVPAPSADLDESEQLEGGMPSAAPEPSSQPSPDSTSKEIGDAGPADASASSNSVAVRVEVSPPDASLALKGKEIRRPWIFKVPKGKRVVLELARQGYRTRRVVLDGSRRVVNVGMVLAPPPEDAQHGPGR